MAKIALLGDTHWGCRNASVAHMDFMDRFYDEVFFPRLKKDDIGTIIQLGDFFDTRKHINFLALGRAKAFIERCAAENIHVVILVGNHDIYYREKVSVNSLELLLGHYENVTLITKPTKLEIATGSIDIIPWICEENREEIADFVAASTAKNLFAHLELSGFDMFKGHPSTHGEDHTMFARYDHVYTGHYHTHSTRDNITYLGTPYEITWADCEDPKVFGILDINEKTGKRKFTTVINPITLFRKIIYDDATTDYDTLPLDFKDSYIKLIVAHRSNDAMYDRFHERLYRETSPIDVSVVDIQTAAFDVELVADTDIVVADPLTIMMKSIPEDGGDTLRTLIMDLYGEAVERGIEE